MLYTELNNEIKKAAIKTEGVHTYTEGDIYLNWDVPNIKYGAVNLGLERADRTDNTIIYNTIIYYADRLLVDSSNKLAIWDDGVRIIQNILNMMSDDITYSLPITYTLFEQLFEDNLAGVYASIAFECSFEQGKCTIDDYIEELKTLYVDKNGNYDVIGYDKVNVDVQANLTYKLIEENGIFVPKGSDGFNVVEVNVPTRDGISEEECREIVEGYNYATEQWVEDKGYLTEHQDLSNYATKDEIPSLDGYATESWVEDKGYLTEHQSLDGYATEQWVSEQGYLTEHLDLSEYALKSELPSLEGYATEQWVEDKNYLTEHQSLDGYATEQWVEDKNYATKDEIPSLDGYATESWVEDKGYLTEHQDLSNYATKDEIPSLDGYATEEWVEDKHYLTEHQDLSDYATKQYVQDQIIEAGGVTIEQVDNEIESKLEDKNYATKDEIPSLDGYATEQWVTEQGYLTEHQDLSEYATKDEIPSLDGYATEQWVENKHYLTEHQSLAGYATEQWVENKHYLTEHQSLDDYALKSEIPSLDGYATEEWVNEQGYLTEHQDLSEYALKSELPSLEGYATELWVSEQGYLTEHQTLKTINGESIVGEGNIEISTDNYLPLTGGEMKGDITLDANNTYKIGDSNKALHTVYANFINTQAQSLTLGARGMAMLVLTRVGTSGNNGLLRKSTETAVVDLGTPSYQFNNIYGINLGHQDFPVNNIYGINLYENGANINTIYAKKSEIPSLDDYLTSAIFQYDAATQTLNINI